MYAKVENNQVVLVNSNISVFGRRANSWTLEDRIANGVYEVQYDTTNLKDQEYYINGNELPLVLLGVLLGCLMLCLMLGIQKICRNCWRAISSCCRRSV